MRFVAEIDFHKSAYPVTDAESTLASQTSQLVECQILTQSNILVTISNFK